MATTYLADLVTAIRKDLHDEDAAAYRWTDAHLQRHIARALADYSNASPLTDTGTLTTTADVRAYALTSLTDVTGRPASVFAIEYPYVAAAPTYPPPLVPFRVWDDTLYLLIEQAPQASETIRVWYHKPHTLSDSTKTYPADDENLIALGAAAYAALERESYAAERITLDPETAKEYQTWGARAMQRFQDELAFRRRSTGQTANTTAAWDTSHI